MTDLTRAPEQGSAYLVIPPQGSRAQSEAERQRISTGLRSAIAQGTFGASGRLPTERALAEQFATSRNTVRKVMDELAEAGLIERHVGRGTFVASGVAPAADAPAGGEEFTLSELLEARLLFEPQLPDLVVERATEENLSVMEAYLAEMRTARTWAEFKEAKYCLHLMLVRSAGNRFLTMIFEQIVASRRRAQWGRPGTHPAPVAAVRETAWRANAAIVEALRAGDAEVASQKIRTYLLETLSATSQS